jgi:hypothetical protein
VPDTTDQVPPDVAFVKAGVDEPTHTLVAPPDIAPTVGRAVTVNDCVTEVSPQLLVTVYVTVTSPAVKPVTTPATLLALPVPDTTDQVPPDVAFVKAGVDEPTHTLVAPPDIAPTVGRAVTVTAKLLGSLVPLMLLAVTVISPFCPENPETTVIESEL